MSALLAQSGVIMAEMRTTHFTAKMFPCLGQILCYVEYPASVCQSLSQSMSLLITFIYHLDKQEGRL